MFIQHNSEIVSMFYMVLHGVNGETEMRLYGIIRNKKLAAC